MRFARFFYVISLSSVLVLSGCHSVNVTMQNNATVPLAPSLVVTSKGIPKPSVGAGTVGPAASVTKTVKLRNGDSYVVNASLPSSAQVFSSAPVTVTSADPKVIDVTVPMSSGIPGINPDDPQTIKAAFSTLGPNVGFNPETVQSVNDSFYGGLVILSCPCRRRAYCTTNRSSWSSHDRKRLERFTVSADDRHQYC